MQRRAIIPWCIEGTCSCQASRGWKASGKEVTVLSTFHDGVRPNMCERVWTRSWLKAKQNMVFMWTRTDGG